MKVKVSNKTRWHSFLQKMTLLFVSILVALVLGEIAVRVFKAGFPGFRISQIVHRPAPGLGFEMIPNQVDYTVASRLEVSAYGYTLAPELSLTSF